MRTNIEIDDGLLAEAMAATGLRTTRKVVEAGLRLLARQMRQADARKLFASAWMSRTTPIAADERARRVATFAGPLCCTADRDLDPMTRHLGLRAL